MEKPTHAPLSCRKKISATTWTTIVSLGDAARPTRLLAPIKLPYDLARACQIWHARNSTPKMRTVARRPKTFENGITTKFPYPRTRTELPVIMVNWLLFLRFHSFSSKGNRGAIDRTATAWKQVYNAMIMTAATAVC